MSRPPILPGEILADELDELGITPTELSRQIGVPSNRFSQIIQGKRAITGDTALRLGHWFKTSAEFWLNLQTAYDLPWRRRKSAAPSRGCRRGRRSGWPDTVPHVSEACRAMPPPPCNHPATN